MLCSLVIDSAVMVLFVSIVIGLGYAVQALVGIKD
jgi:hypothetical protein